MNKLKLYLALYYPIILSFFSFLYSVGLWFSGYKLEGIFVGIWVPSILCFAIAIRQRRNDFLGNKQQKEDIKIEEEENESINNNVYSRFYNIHTVYLWFIIYDLLFTSTTKTGIRK